MAKSKNKIIDVVIPKEEIEKKVETSLPEIKAIHLKFIPYLIFIILSFCVYSSSLNNDFALDDLLAIKENKFVLKGTKGLKEILTTDAFVGFFGTRGATLISGGRYRPLSYATFALEYEMYGLKPHYSHAINVFLFGILCCCIYYFLRVIPTEKIPKIQLHPSFYGSFAFLVTLLFLLHPIHTEVVANIKGRDEIFGMIFSMLTMILFIHFIQTEKKQYLVMSMVSLFLGLMSKENAITFLGIIPLAIYVFFGKENKKTNVLLGMGLLIISVACYLKLRATYTATGVGDSSPEILNNPFVRANAEEKWATIIYSFLMYFKLLIFPHPLTHDYYFNQIPYKHFTEGSVVLSILAHVAIGFYFVKEVLKKSMIAFAIGFYIMSFSIVSNIPFTVGIIMNERFVFVASLGFIMVLVYGMMKWVETNKKYQQLVTIVILGICIGYSIKTFSRNYAWKDNHTLFETDVITSSNSAKVTTALAADYLELVDSTNIESEKQELCEKSLEYVNRALEIYPENSGAYLLKGNAIFKRNQNYDSAILCFRMALSYRPTGYFDGNYNMAATFMNQKRYDSSMVYSKQAFSINDRHSSSARILAFSYLMTGNLQEAEITYKKVEELEGVKLFDSENSKWIYFADNLKEAGNIKNAMELYDKVLANESNNANANYGKGIILGKLMNQLLPSIPYLEKAVKLDTSKVNWKEDLAVAYGFTGQYAKTIPLLESVIKAEPEYANAYQNLAASYSYLGNKAMSSRYNEIAKTKKIK